MAKTKDKKADSAEQDARRALIEDLFYDFNRNRSQVYKMNFIRGIFFGFGTILGGTVLVAFMIWSLGQFANWFPTINVPINIITESLRK